MELSKISPRVVPRQSPFGAPRFRHGGVGWRRGWRGIVPQVFTGIVQGVATVEGLRQKENLTEFEMRFPEELDVVVGASVALNGTCLTVTTVQKDVLTFDAIAETLVVTNLSQLHVNSAVNYERAARFGDEIGGHALSGHVHTLATVLSIEETPNNRRVTLAVAASWMKYIFSKGFIALDGVSLTACEAESDRFSVYLIPETLRVTTLKDWRVGSLINLEIEAQTQAIVDTVERVMERYQRGSNLTTS